MNHLWHEYCTVLRPTHMNTEHSRVTQSDKVAPTHHLLCPDRCVRSTLQQVQRPAPTWSCQCCCSPAKAPRRLRATIKAIMHIRNWQMLSSLCWDQINDGNLTAAALTVRVDGNQTQMFPPNKACVAATLTKKKTVREQTLSRHQTPQIVETNKTCSRSTALL